MGVRLSSSGQKFTYVESGYLADGYVHDQHVLEVCLETQSSTIECSAQLLLNAGQFLTSGNSSSSGVASRHSNALEADLTADEVGVSVVTGDGERSVVDVSSAVVVTDNSDVSSTVVRTSNGTSQIQSGDSQLSGVGVKKYNISANLETEQSTVSGRAPIVTSAALTTSSSSIDCSAERVLAAGTVALETIDPQVEGVAERKVLGTAQVSSDASDASGVAERVITCTGTLSSSDVSLTGLSERSSEGELSVISSPAEVSGVAERSIKTSVELSSTASSTTGVAERIFGTSANLTTEESSVTGVVERSVTGSGIIETNSDLSGVAERIIPSSGSAASGSSSLEGTSVRGINGAGNLQASDVSSVGLSERTIVLQSGAEPVSSSRIETIVTRTVHALEADLTSDEVGVSVVAGDGERSIFSVVSSIEAGDATLAATVEITSNAIDASVVSSSSVTTGVVERIVVSQGSLVAQTSVVTGDTERFISSQPVDLSVSPVSVSGAAERIVETNNEDQELRPTAENLVTGVAERTINSSGQLAAGEYTVSGVAERIIRTTVELSASSVDVTSVTKRLLPPVSSELVVSDVVLEGVAERIIRTTVELTSPESTITGVAERSFSTSSDLAPEDVVVSGTVERIIPQQGSANFTPNINNEVSGTASRVITASGELTVEDVEIVCVAKKAAVASPALKASPSIVVGSTKRSRGATGEIVSGPSEVVGDSGRLLETAYIPLSARIRVRARRTERIKVLVSPVAKVAD